MKILLLLGLIAIAAGCHTPAEKDTTKFVRFFSWGRPVSEEDAAKFAAAGVTDVLVSNRKQFDLAVKYGMRPYWKCFIPAGPYRQVMTPDEEKLYNYINGKDLDRKMPSAERQKIIHRRRTEKRSQYGGEAVVHPDPLTSIGGISCFISDTDFSLSRKKLDKILESAPDGTAGIFLDYIGYMNHFGCYCTGCRKKYAEYLKNQKLADTQENRNVFYRDRLVEYYNRVIDHIRQRRPDFKVAIHVYPDFEPEHLYGNRTKADFCGQTVAWYFQWPADKIRKYTRYVTGHAKDHHPDAEGIPFLGLSTDPKSSLGYKTPADVERELRDILSAGGRTLMICCGKTIIEPGYFEVFRKYCGK